MVVRRTINGLVACDGPGGSNVASGLEKRGRSW